MYREIEVYNNNNYDNNIYIKFININYIFIKRLK